MAFIFITIIAPLSFAVNACELTRLVLFLWASGFHFPFAHRRHHLPGVVGDNVSKNYVKENQKLKYLNSDSTHAKCCLKAIPHGIFGRLAKLTSTSRSKLETRIDKLYPNHTNALEIAGLAPKKYPKLKGILNFISTNNNERRKNHPQSRI